jgi:ADP-ribose pyrophosphatase
MPAEIVARRQVYAGKIVDIEIQTLRLADGRPAQNEVVLHRPCVAMVAVDRDNRLVLVRQYRSPAGAELLEIPAGSIDDGEQIETAVQRELQEEIGAKAGRLQRLGGFYVAPGYCTEYIHVYLCEDLRDSRLPADEDEVIEVERLSLSEALERVATGAIQDAKSVTGLLLYAQTRA